ncbi:MAG: biotin--[acetyl-CoA-carboxylase] ligase [Bacteroidaceae bacterium]|nr:biotin--[acetyl-CoA-carboxylase] ligase [Bacteroidaceae bacterium]
MIALDEVDSTNSFLRHLDTSGDQRLTLATAEFQSAGRGAGTNRWESARGENLLFSLHMMPGNLPVRRMFAISEVTALALKESFDSFSLPLQGRGGLSAAAPFTPPLEEEGETTIKWPNDIYFEDSKVAGMLIENDLQGALVQRSIIGIGINVNQRRFVSDAPNPRSLADIVGHDVDRRLVLERFMERFMNYMPTLDASKLDALDALHNRYKSCLYRFGEEHEFVDEMGVFCARIIDVEQSGHLVLQDKAGSLRRYEFKEVKFRI